MEGWLDDERFLLTVADEMLQIYSDKSEKIKVILWKFRISMLFLLSNQLAILIAHSSTARNYV